MFELAAMNRAAMSTRTTVMPTTLGRPAAHEAAPTEPRYVRLRSVANSRVRAHEAPDDAALAGLLATRDPRGIELLYDRHGSAVYGLARRVVGDEQVAQDVVQEVFMAIWRGAASYDGSRGTLTAWLYALTHHKSVDAVRRAQRHASRRAPEEVLATHVDPVVSVEEHAIDAERRDRVRAALAQLPEPQRNALLLAYFGGYSQSEIAQLTSTPLGTVKTRTLAALRRLNGMLADVHAPAATDGSLRADGSQPAEGEEV